MDNGNLLGCTRKGFRELPLRSYLLCIGRIGLLFVAYDGRTLLDNTNRNDNGIWVFGI